MELVKEKLEMILRQWDKTKISVKQKRKWVELPLSEVKDQSEIAKFVMLSISPYIR